MTRTPITPPVPPSDPWSRRTRDLWFYGALGLSALGVLHLLSIFLFPLLFAGVTAVVSWPLFRRLLRTTRGGRLGAALLTVLVLAVVVFGPLSVVVYLFVEQAVGIVAEAAQWIREGGLASLVARFDGRPEWIPEWVRPFLREDFDLQRIVAGPLQDAALAGLNWAGAQVPMLIGTTFTALVDVVVFFIAVVSLYTHGPAVLRVVKNLSPLQDDYEDRLFAVFAEFANNLVVGSLASAVVQGTFAGVGYQIAGVEQVVFFALLTAVFGFVPLVGTMTVWVPLAVQVGMEHGPSWGLFLACWGVLTSNVDNLVRPLFMRGRTDLHPGLVFLAVFGGLAWLGLPGALIGPVIVATFLSLYTIYLEDYLNLPPPAPEPRPGLFARLLVPIRRALERWGARRRASQG